MSSRRPDIILASTSPYRRQLLERLGIAFAQEAPGSDETRQAGESAVEMVMRLAKAKAADVAARHPQGLVIGSDQCALRDHEILGKPGNEEKAMEQLRAASGKRVRFLTAVCVMNAASGELREHLDETVVTFRELDDASLRRYIAAEKPLDCAGSFKSEALGITLFEKIENEDPTALMGLPLIALARLLREAGVELP